MRKAHENILLRNGYLLLMKTRKWTAVNNKSQHFLIDEDGNVGFYLYVYNDGDERCIRDHLQDTLEIAKRQALEDYEVPEDAWKQIE